MARLLTGPTAGLKTIFVQSSSSHWKGKLAKIQQDSMFFKIFICDWGKGMLSKSPLLDEIIRFHGKKREFTKISVVRQVAGKKINNVF